MPRLRNRSGGSVVNVSDDTAARLGADWEPVDADRPARRVAKKAAPKADK